MGIFDIFKKKTANDYYMIAVKSFESDYSKAMLNLDKAIQLEPHNAYLYYTRGTMNKIKLNYKEAIPDLEKSLELKIGKITFNKQTTEFNPAEAHFNLGLSRFHTNDNKGALKEAKKAKKLGYENPGLDDLFWYIEEVEEIGYDEFMKQWD